MDGGNCRVSWKCYSKEITTSLLKFKDEIKYTDATILCAGHRYPVHKVILAASSKYFEELFCQMENVHPLVHPVIVLNNVNKSGLEAILNFIYIGEVNVPKKDVSEVFDVAKELKIKGLCDDALRNICLSEKSQARITDHSYEGRFSMTDEKKRKHDSGSPMTLMQNIKRQRITLNYGGCQDPNNAEKSAFGDDAVIVESCHPFEDNLPQDNENVTNVEELNVAEKDIGDSDSVTFKEEFYEEPQVSDTETIFLPLEDGAEEVASIKNEVEIEDDPEVLDHDLSESSSRECSVLVSDKYESPSIHENFRLGCSSSTTLHPAQPTTFDEDSVIAKESLRLPIRLRPRKDAQPPLIALTPSSPPPEHEYSTSDKVEPESEEEAEDVCDAGEEAAAGPSAAKKKRTLKKYKYTEQQEVVLVKFYKENPLFYDKALYEFKDTKKKKSLQQEIAKQLNIELAAVSAFFRNMRTRWGKIKHKKGEAKNLTSREFWIYEQLDFLRPYLSRSRGTSSKISDIHDLVKGMPQDDKKKLGPVSDVLKIIREGHALVEGVLAEVDKTVAASYIGDVLKLGMAYLEFFKGTGLKPSVIVTAGRHREHFQQQKPPQQYGTPGSARRESWGPALARRHHPGSLPPPQTDYRDGSPHRSEYQGEHYQHTPTLPVPHHVPTPPVPTASPQGSHFGTPTVSPQPGSTVFPLHVSPSSSSKLGALLDPLQPRVEDVQQTQEEQHSSTHLSL